jgi:glycosyltransferase involved in cell wall biosynthesis
MKVLIIGHKLHGGGAEFVTSSWINFLSENGVDVRFFSTDATVAEEDSTPFLNFIRSRFGILRLLTAVRTVRKQIQIWDADVVLSMQTLPNIVNLFASFFWPTKQHSVVISERTVPSILLRREAGAQKIQLFLAKWIYKYADAVVAISHPVAADLVCAFSVPQGRCYVVPNPALQKVKDFGSLQMHQKTPTLQNSAESITLVLPFRLSQAKRPILAVQVASELRNRGFEVELRSYGVGELRDELAHEAASVGVPVDFRGWVETWFLDLPTNTVVLLPSIVEGFGNVLVEAAAAGVPVVAWSGALGVSDAIVPGVTGFFALSDDQSDFADAIVRCFSLPRTDIKGWLDYFSAESSGHALMRVLAIVSRAK